MSTKDASQDGASMRVEAAVLIGRHLWWYRRGQPAHIIGVCIVTPANQPGQPRPCLHVLWPDGDHDLVSLADVMKEGWCDVVAAPLKATADEPVA